SAGVFIIDTGSADESERKRCSFQPPESRIKKANPFSAATQVFYLIRLAACLNGLQEALPTELDDGNFIGSFTGDKGQFIVRTEGKVRRSAAHLYACSGFVFMRIDDADTGLAGVRYHQPFSVRARGKEVRINTNRNRADDLTRSTIPYGQFIGREIGHVSV